MNFMGMGLPEVAVIMVIAFLALGPSKSIDMARTAGKVIRDLRKTFNEVAASVSLDDDSTSSNRTNSNTSSQSEPRDGPPPSSQS